MMAKVDTISILKARSQSTALGNKQGVSATKVEQLTCFPEMLDGRVKTLHLSIHGGILARRDQKHHMEALNEHGIGTFDVVVVVNLYPFHDEVFSGGIEFEDEIETQAQDFDEPVKQSREGHDAQQPKLTIEGMKMIVEYKIQRKKNDDPE
ncbi:hypothetical protein PVL29_026140 [Vitis rotundifolia]|uniref:MGS-like domain-containing protein n=1 Tax=Vitis rotundifolia TaxID=103349 RepID=A0AA39D7D1_VITRO|nr:hypothetical protein PVL29_026140 [Vitis rotundifolia]